MQLGCLAHHRGATRFAEGGYAIFQCLAHAMRRFIDHQRARFFCQRFQPEPARRAARRQKALETEPVRGQCADRERGNRGARSRNGDDLETRRRHRAHQLKPRIADGGRAGIADQRNRLALAQPCNYFNRAHLFVVIVQRYLRRSDTKVLEKNSGVACVLRRDERTVRQYGARSRGEITQIADWRRDDVKLPRGRQPCPLFCHYNPRLYLKIQEREGMAGISRRPRLARYAILTVSLMATACSLFRPVETPVDKQEQAARLVRDGKHAEAAQAYADLAMQLPSESDNYELLSAEQWVAAANIPAAKQALAQVSPEARTKLAIPRALVAR